LSRFGPEKVPGFVHNFFRELFCNSLFLFYSNPYSRNGSIAERSCNGAVQPFL